MYKWKHAEEWITFTDDTVEGFDLLTELHCDESPLVIHFLSSSPDLMIGSRRGWEKYDQISQETSLIHPLSPADVPSSCMVNSSIYDLLGLQYA